MWHIWQKWKITHSGGNYFDMRPICRPVLSYFDDAPRFSQVFNAHQDFHQFPNLIRLLGQISEDESLHLVWQKNLQRILLKAARNSLEIQLIIWFGKNYELQIWLIATTSFWDIFITSTNIFIQINSQFPNFVPQTKIFAEKSRPEFPSEDFIKNVVRTEGTFINKLDQQVLAKIGQWSLFGIITDKW